MKHDGYLEHVHTYSEQLSTLVMPTQPPSVAPNHQWRRGKSGSEAGGR
jgi:hypothetical protein